MKENGLLKGGIKMAGGRVKKMRGIIILSLISYILYLGCAFEAEESAPDLNAPDRPGVTPGENLMELRWTKMDTATDYEVYYSTGEAGERVNWKTVRPTDEITVVESLVEITMTGLDNGKEYWVWTKAIYPRGTSDYSEGASGTPLEKPGVPSSLKLEPGDAFFEAQWNKPILGGVSQYYEIYYSKNTTPKDTDVGIKTTNTKTIVSNVPNGATYNVWVRALNTAGHSSWIKDSSGGVTLQDPSGPPTAAQSEFDLYPGTKRLTVNWTPPDTDGPFVSRFKVYYTTDSAAPAAWDQLTPTPDTSGDKYLTIESPMSTTINSLINGTKYYVYIQTGNSKGFNNEPSGLIGKSETPVKKDPPAGLLTDNNFEVCEITAAFVNAEIGHGDRLARKKETEYSDLIGDALVWWAGEQYNENGEQKYKNIDFAFYNGGLIIDAIGLPKRDRNGKEVTDPDSVGYVKLSDIKASIKDDKISVIMFPGSKMKDLFDYVANVIHNGSGQHGTGYFGQVSQECRYTIDYTYDPEHVHGVIPWGDPNDRVKISGEDIDPEKTYIIVTTTYLAEGGDGYAVLSANSREIKTGVPVWQAVASYMYDRCPPAIIPKTDGRITLRNECWDAAKGL